MENNGKKVGVVKILLAAVLVFAFIIYFAWSNIIAFGDKLIKQDHIRRANLLFEIADMLNPHTPNLAIRLKITRALLGYANVIDAGLTKTNSQDQDVFVSDTGTVVPILLYHYLRNDPNNNNVFGVEMSVPPDLFDKQMNYLVNNGFHSLTLDQFRNILITNGKFPDKPVVITIDDGYENLYSVAYPILKKYNLSANAFIITDFVDGPDYLTWNEIKEMNGDNTIGFESHTLDHAPLTTLDEDQVRSELVDSKKVLEKQLGKPVDWLAYPYGITNADVEKIASSSGYLGAVNIYHDSLDPTYKMFTLPRIIIKGSDTLDVFTEKVNSSNN